LIRFSSDEQMSIQYSYFQEFLSSAEDPETLPEFIESAGLVMQNDHNFRILLTHAFLEKAR